MEAFLVPTAVQIPVLVKRTIASRMTSNLCAFVKSFGLVAAVNETCCKSDRARVVVFVSVTFMACFDCAFKVTC